MSARLLEGDAHDKQLRALVHPPGWANPVPGGRYNLVVVGAGTAGLVCAAGAAGLGARVALVERDLMGGDCLNVGCVPSKGMIAAARRAAEVRDAGAFGVRVDGVHVDFAAAMERMRKLRASIAPNDGAERFRKLGVDVYLGAGRFTGRDTLEVEGRTLRFARAVIATGGRAAAPPIPGLEQAGYLTNENVFTLTERPARLAVIGAGPIGCELAQAFARLGSRVELVELADRVLSREDQDAAAIVQKALQRDGITLHLGVKTTEASRRGAEKVVQLSDGKQLAVDEILVGVGRAPNVDGLGLEAAGVAYDAQKGVTVDDHLRTSNPRIYAAGDVCSAYKFTHAADFMARIVIQNALFFGRKKASALTIPWCTYTDPEVAHVGVYDTQDVQTFVQPFREVDRAILEGETEGFVKVHVARGSDRIVGATIVARHAGEMLSEISVAMAAGMGLGALASVIHPYPTQAEAIRKLGDQYNRTRLTPRARAILSTILRWRR